MLAVHLLALPAHSAPTSWLHNIAQHCNIKLTGVSVSNTSEKGVLKQALQYTRGLHLYVYIWFIPEFCHGTKYGSAVHHTSHKMQMEKLHHVANAPWRKMTWHDVTMLFYITKLLKDLASLHGLILTRKARSIPGLNDFKIEVSPLDAFSIFKPVEAALVPAKKNIGSVSTMPRSAMTHTINHHHQDPHHGLDRHSYLQSWAYPHGRWPCRYPEMWNSTSRIHAVQGKWWAHISPPFR